MTQESTRRRAALRATCVATALALCVFAPTIVVASPAAAAKPAADNLGDGLLEGLDGAAFAPAPNPTKGPAKGPDAQPAAADKPLVDLGEVEAQMNRAAGAAPAGEDVGESPLLSVVRTMEKAESMIADESNAVPEQRKAVAELDKLIAQMEKQCQGGGKSGKPSSKKSPQKSQRSGAKPGKGSKPAGLAEGAPSSGAKTSSTQVRAQKATDPSGKAPADLVKAAWGHLPARVRERMLQGSADEFLPEYRDELEAYYKRLAEREAER
ncbi:MAG: hypothetical protein ACRCT8_02725 [Lacipirellulaceae bacterium]